MKKLPDNIKDNSYFKEDFLFYQKTMSNLIAENEDLSAEYYDTITKNALKGFCLKTEGLHIVHIQENEHEKGVEDVMFVYKKSNHRFIVKIKSYLSNKDKEITGYSLVFDVNAYSNSVAELEAIKPFIKAEIEDTIQTNEDTNLTIEKGTFSYTIIEDYKDKGVKKTNQVNNDDEMTDEDFNANHKLVVQYTEKHDNKLLTSLYRTWNLFFNTYFEKELTMNNYNFLLQLKNDKTFEEYFQDPNFYDIGDIYEMIHFDENDDFTSESKELISMQFKK